MAIYVANQNGDWWEVDTDKTTALYVLDTEKLTFLEKVEIVNEWDDFDPEQDDPATLDEMLEGAWGQDKFEKMIWDFGTEQIIQL